MFSNIKSRRLTLNNAKRKNIEYLLRGSIFVRNFAKYNIFIKSLFSKICL